MTTETGAPKTHSYTVTCKDGGQIATLASSPEHAIAKRNADLNRSLAATKRNSRVWYSATTKSLAVSAEHSPRCHSCNPAAPTAASLYRED